MMGLSTTTPVRYREKKIGHKVEARVGIAMFGSTMMTREQMDAAGRDPFSNLWFDNYCHGTGATREEALAALNRHANQIAASLWVH